MHCFHLRCPLRLLMYKGFLANKTSSKATVWCSLPAECLWKQLSCCVTALPSATHYAAPRAAHLSASGRGEPPPPAEVRRESGAGSGRRGQGCGRPGPAGGGQRGGGRERLRRAAPRRAGAPGRAGLPPPRVRFDFLPRPETWFSSRAGRRRRPSRRRLPSPLPALSLVLQVSGGRARGWVGQGSGPAGAAFPGDAAAARG